MLSESHLCMTLYSLRMGALGNIVREPQERLIQEGRKPDSRDNNYGEKVIHEQKSNEIQKEHERVNISISRKAYETLEKFTKELNERESTNKRSFTIEEVLDEEMILLFSDEWKTDSNYSITVPFNTLNKRPDPQ
jgi:hypothetical protein